MYDKNNYDINDTDQHLGVKLGKRAHWRASYRSFGKTFQPSFY